MAAGMTIAREDLQRFSEAFDESVRETLDAADLEAAITTDGPLAPAELSLDTAFLLRKAGPWGQHFPEPLFDGDFQVINQRIVGENHLKLTVQPAGGGPAGHARRGGAGADHVDGGDTYRNGELVGFEPA